MTSLNVEFNPWDKRKDILLFRPGNSLGYGAIQTGFHPGGAPDNTHRDAVDITETVNGVIGVVAGGIEWLRKYGITPEVLEQRIHAYIVTNRGASPESLLLARLQRTLEDQSDVLGNASIGTTVIG